MALTPPRSSWDLGGGPDDATLHRLVDQERRTDTEIAELYGVRRQTARYWRLRAGIAEPARPRARRDRRYSHKDTIWWAVKREHLNHPIRRRLVDYSLAKQGAEIAPDARGRLTEFLDYLAKNDLVVAYDPDYEQYGLAEPFYFVPRDPNLDAHGEIVRRHRVETETRQNAVQYDRGRRESDGYAEGARDGAAEQRDLDRDIVENRIMPIIESLEALNSALRDAVALIGRQAR